MLPSRFFIIKNKAVYFKTLMITGLVEYWFSNIVGVPMLNSHERGKLFCKDPGDIQTGGSTCYALVCIPVQTMPGSFCSVPSTSLYSASLTRI